MVSEFQGMIDFNTDIHGVHTCLRNYIVTHDPPYDLRAMMAPHTTRPGRRVRIVLHHASRNLTITEGDIRHHVLRTAVTAFQQHSVRQVPSVRRVPQQVEDDFDFFSRPAPVTNRTNFEFSSTNIQNTGKQCAVCLETIMSNELSCLPCAHVFHNACIQRWLNQSNSCPECRFELT